MFFKFKSWEELEKRDNKIRSKLCNKFKEEENKKALNYINGYLEPFKLVVKKTKKTLFKICGNKVVFKEGVIIITREELLDLYKITSKNNLDVNEILIVVRALKEISNNKDIIASILLGKEKE